MLVKKLRTISIVHCFAPLNSSQTASTFNFCTPPGFFKAGTVRALTYFSSLGGEDVRSGLPKNKKKDAKTWKLGDEKD